MTLNLNLLCLYRLNGQDLPAAPGLMAVTPPRKTARGREQDNLIVYLLLSGNAPFSTAEYTQLTGLAVSQFYNTPGAVTSALRAAAEHLNRALLDRNLASTGRGQYAIGWLILGALRGDSLYLLQSGTTHVFWQGQDETRHIHDESLSGKGLGLNQAISPYYSQLPLKPGERLLLCGKLPTSWEGIVFSDRGLPALESTRKRMMALAEGDLNAVLAQTQSGPGDMTILRPAAVDLGAPPPATPTPLVSPSVAGTEGETAPAAPADSDQDFRGLPDIEELGRPAHVVGHPPADQPSAYAIPPEPVEETPPSFDDSPALRATPAARTFPPSIPRLQPTPPEPEPPPLAEIADEAPVIGEIDFAETPSRRGPSPGTRQAARLAVNGMQAWRRAGGRLSASLQNFLPRLLPGSRPGQPLDLPAWARGFIAVAVPILVVTIAVVMYFRFGRNAQYDTYMAQAIAMEAQAINETNPMRQRDLWKNVLTLVGQAESFGETPESEALRVEAQNSLDVLEGVRRLDFAPAFSNGVGVQISRMSASETDLFMLDAVTGNILHAPLAPGGLNLDTAFSCAPGTYGNNSVGPMVDLVVLPKQNLIDAAVMGVDAAGNLLYCKSAQVAQAFALPPPNTNWGRVTAMAFDNGNLYILDAPARAVWIFPGKSGTFVDSPLFYFGTQVPEIQNAIDIAVSGSEMYLLHSDGSLTRCTYSSLEAKPTRCDSPVQLVNPFPATAQEDVFAQAHFTQLTLTAPPISSIFLLDADRQGVYSIGSQGLELQGILRPASPLPPGTLGAMTESPNHVLYVALGDQVYFSTAAP
ncbi:MAG: hypothetical protein ACOYZ8_17015 [Chloroflexota bacterium]